jgi:hypothetical protein
VSGAVSIGTAQHLGTFRASKECNEGAHTTLLFLSNIRILFLTCVIAVISAAQAKAQENQAQPVSRAEQIEAERMEKALHLPLNQPSRGGKGFAKAGEVVHWVYQGAPIHIQLGGLPEGSGFAAGPVLEWNSRTGQIVDRTWAVGSIYGFYDVGTSVEWPRVTSQRLSIALEGSHLYAPQIDYYGPGPQSSINNRTDFLREDTLFEVRAEWRAHEHVRPGCSAGGLLINVGPGTADGIASSETVFSSVEAPGINIQSNYLVAGCSAGFEYLDIPGDPHKGTRVAAGFHHYSAQDQNVFTFNRFSAAAEQYVPFLNGKRVIALNAQTELSYHPDGRVVPFYMQPTLGGSYNLRGFPRYRFYDENSLLFNAEYRWEISTGFDLALFGDAGNVFRHPSQISLSHLKTDAGFGLRFKNLNRILVRIDTGFSQEGFETWINFDNVF